MKRLFYLACSFCILVSCSKKNYLDRSDEDKALLDAVKKLNKEPGDQKALEAIPILYSNIKQQRLSKINSYSNSNELSRWDKIVGQYEQLQAAYDAISGSPAAGKLVTPEDFSQVLSEQKKLAAADYYQSAENYLSKNGRDNARKAYSYFRKSAKFIPGYLDAQAKMEEAFKQAQVKVVINPVEDNSYFMNRGWGWGPNYSNEYFQQTLLRELNSQGDRFPALFYADWEATRDRIDANWVIDLRLRNMDVPNPYTRQYNRTSSARVQIGTDTAGRPVYQTVYATLYVTQMSFTARGEMEVQIRDIQNRKNIGFRNFRDEYRWEEERATFRGDSRALSPGDWQIINRSGFNTPRQEDIVREIYRRIYPSVKNYIIQNSDW